MRDVVRDPEVFIPHSDPSSRSMNDIRTNKSESSPHLSAQGDGVLPP